MTSLIPLGFGLAFAVGVTVASLDAKYRARREMRRTAILLRGLNSISASVCRHFTQCTCALTLMDRARLALDEYEEARKWAS